VAMMPMLPCFLVLQRFFKIIAMRYRFLSLVTCIGILLMMLFTVFTSLYVIGLSLCFSMTDHMCSVSCRMSIDDCLSVIYAAIWALYLNGNYAYKLFEEVNKFSLSFNNDKRQAFVPKFWGWLWILNRLKEHSTYKLFQFT